MSPRYVVTAAFAAIAVALAGTAGGLAASAGASTSHSVLDRVATGNADLSASSAVTAVPAAKRPRYVVLDCGQRLVRPDSYVLACADDGLGLRGLHWTSWTSRLASGYGTFYENDCKPSCAAGHVHRYRADVTLWRTARVPARARERQYTTITVLFPGQHRPPVYHRENGKLVATHPRVQTFRAY